MTREELAQRLNGRQYGDEITSLEEKIARESGLVVVFGYSDDNMELRGAINDELGCYNGGAAYLRKKGVVMLPDDDEAEVLKRFRVYDQVVNAPTKKIHAIWDKEGYSCTYTIDVPFSTFDILEGDEKYCRGIVFSVEDLP